MDDLIELKQEIYNLEFGETCLSEFQCYTRVPGGWVYQQIDPVTNYFGQGIFIPWNNEFQDYTRYTPSNEFQEK